MKKKGRISVAEAAKIAMVSTSTVGDWVRGQKVDAVSYAHAWWVSEKSLRAHIARAVS